MFMRRQILAVKRRPEHRTTTTEVLGVVYLTPSVGEHGPGMASRHVLFVVVLAVEMGVGCRPACGADVEGVQLAAAARRSWQFGGLTHLCGRRAEPDRGRSCRQGCQPPLDRDPAIESEPNSAPAVQVYCWLSSMTKLKRHHRRLTSRGGDRGPSLLSSLRRISPNEALRSRETCIWEGPSRPAISDWVRSSKKRK